MDVRGSVSRQRTARELLAVVASLTNEWAAGIVHRHLHLKEELLFLVLHIHLVGEGNLNRAVDNRLPRGTALCLVCLEQVRSGQAANRQGQLPAEVPRVLDTGVHALPTRGRVQVRGVAGDEDPATR